MLRPSKKSTKVELSMAGLRMYRGGVRGKILEHSGRRMEAREHVVTRHQRRKVELESLGHMNRAVVAGSLHTQH